MNNPATEEIRQSPKFSNPFAAVDKEALIKRIKSVLLNPKNAWDDLLRESRTVKEIYTQDVAMLALIPAVCGFIRNVFIGYFGFKWGFFSGLSMAITQYATAFGVVFVLSYFLERFAPKFGGAVDKTAATKLAAYSLIPGLLSGVFTVIPGIGILSVFASVYGLYVLWHGIPAVTKVGAEQRGIYFGQTVAGTFLSMMVAVIIMMVLSPEPPVINAPQNIKLPGGLTIDLNEMEKATKQLEKIMPK